MPRLQGSNWASPPASRGNIRDARSSLQGRGGYQAVDSWRSYNSDANTLQSSVAGRTRSNAGFDPYGQVLDAQGHGGDSIAQSQYNRQAPHDRGIVSRPSQQPQQEQGYPQQTFGATPYYQQNTQPPQYPQTHAGVTTSHFKPYEPLRFTNGLQDRSQHSYQSAGGSWRGSQPTFTQQVSIRPSRGADASRDYSVSAHQERGHRHFGASKEKKPQLPLPDDRRRQSRQSTPIRENVPPPPPKPPVASQAYLAQAHLPPVQLEKSKRLLVILDLNGTLVLKAKCRKPEDLRIRPGARQLLDYLFAHHSVMVYTSAQPQNANSTAQHLFSGQQHDELVAIWSRDKLDLTPAQYNSKVQVYKKLDKIWANNEIQASYFPPGNGRWDQTNTVLVDDSHLKALQEPHNLLQVVEFTGNSLHLQKKQFEKREEQICQSLVLKLEVLKWQNDVSRLIWRWQTGEVEIPKLPGSNFFVDEKVDQKEQARKDLEAAMNLPTPKTPETSDSEVSDEDGQAVLGKKPRGESPVSEAVFKELLAAGKHKSRELRTPESLDG